MRRLAASLLIAWAGLAPAAELADELTGIRHDWEVIRYQTPGSERAPRYEALARTLELVCNAHPSQAEPLAWEGIVLASWADERNFFAALDLRARARAAFEAAIHADPRTLDGAALAGLGELYLKSAYWPLGFRSPARAHELLLQALAIAPDSAEANTDFADYLMDSGQPEQAREYLERALQAPLRPGHQVADTGLREAARRRLAELGVSSR